MIGIFHWSYFPFTKYRLFFYLRLRIFLPKEYNFAPKTWTLPNDYNLWYSYASNQPKNYPSTYIVKPNNAAMGQG